MNLPTVPPQQIGKYRVLSVLGEGAMGVVYRAHDPSIDREVAVKTIRKQVLANEQVAAQMVERFRREAVAAGRLTHPGIVAVYDYGEVDDAAFIVMELAPGTSLEHHVDRNGPFSTQETLGLMTQVLEALGYAHSRGVVHRDIKPANLLVSVDGRVKITDFGIARIESSNLTHAGTTLGTPMYMAPEQFIGGPIDHRIDLFAVGVMVYELLTGERPFGGETLQALAYQVVHGQHVPPTQRNPMLPPLTDAVLATALAKKPEARYASAAELARGLALALAPWQAGQPAVVVPAPALSETALASSVMPTGPATGNPLLSSAIMRELEGALAGVLGPLAGGMVRRCATRTTDVNGFVEALCQNAPTPADRSRIEQTTRATLARSIPGGGRLSSPEISGMRPAMSSQPSSIDLAVSSAVSPEDVSRVVAELAKAVGPIARVLVKKALPRATDLRSLCLLAAEGIEQEAERARFLQAMKVG